MSFNAIAAGDFEFMLSEFGEVRTRTPATGDSVEVAGIWEPAPPELDENRGRVIVLRGKLSIRDSETVKDSDQWTVDGHLWQTDAIGSADNGMRVIELIRTVSQRTKHLPRTL